MSETDHSRRRVLVLGAVAAAAAFAPAAAGAAQNSIKSLPKAQTDGGRPLMEALAQRKSTRAFSDRPLTEQELSNLLWATWGVNRPNGMRTAPSARNRQDAVVYAVLEDGVWEYDASAQALKQALPGDQRDKFGGAPLTLLYAAPGDEFSTMLLGALYQNAGLYCASAGLGDVVKAGGRDALAGKLPLPPGYKVLIVQSVGWPK